MEHSGEAIDFSFKERRRPAPGIDGGRRVRRIGWAELGKRLAAGEVLWDLRPVHEHLRFRLEGAVNLGHLDWLVAEPEQQRLLDPDVIARVLARGGIFRGTAVILQSGERRERLDLAVRALNAIGIHRITCLDGGYRSANATSGTDFERAFRAMVSGSRLH